MRDAPDDSYHSAWFGKMAAEFEHAIAEGSSHGNLDEARNAMRLIEASRASSASGGASVRLS